MNSLFLFLLVSLLSTFVIQQSASRFKEDHDNVKTLSYPTSAREIVKDLIANWNSPLVYLKNRGYLKTPQMGFEMMLGEKHTDEVMASKDNKKMQRVARSSEEATNDLSYLFRTLFSSSDNSVSDKIKSKLGVPWDMNALKNSVRSEAHKFYDNFYEKRHQQALNSKQGEDNTDIERQVAQLYPSLVITPNKEQEKYIEPSEQDVHKEPKFLNGIAKLLTSRAKPLPLQLKEQKKTVQEDNPAT
ncbi:uncharacterized protein LOC6561262 [Drosophila grimshawi]|uniref:GH21569 n=1 Tax=Drosophila grimshawi TaxID=7222 RepID=B4J4W4_DROGR|nr:uncharacterized protein LOC6561262 [Drosophila grimshawi]EDW01670.1 GH21569 [Drosophila grimshawi]